MDEDDKQNLEAGADGDDSPISARRMRFGQRYEICRNKVNGTAVNKEGFPIMNEPITLTMMAPDVGVQNWKDMIVEMEEKTGISFRYLNAPKDSFDTKKNLVFASGDYPDVLCRRLDGG